MSGESALESLLGIQESELEREPPVEETETDKGEVVDPPVEEVVDPVVEDSSSDTQEEVDPFKEEEEFNFDKPVTKKDEEGSLVELTEEDFKDPERKNMAYAGYSKTKEVLKTKEREIVERDLELTDLREKLSSLEAQASQLTSTNPDPFKDPDYMELHDAVKGSITEFSESLQLKSTGNVSYEDSFVDMLNGFSGLKGDRVKHRQFFIENSINLLGIQVEEHEDLMSDDGSVSYEKVLGSLSDLDRMKVETTMSDLAKNLMEHSQGAAKMQSMRDDIVENGEKHFQRISLENHKKNESALLESMKTVGVLSEDVEKENPNTFASFLSSQMRTDENPEHKAAALKSIVEARFGLRPLTDSEKSVIEDRGHDVGEFQKAREEKAAERTEKLFQDLYLFRANKPAILELVELGLKAKEQKEKKRQDRRTVQSAQSTRTVRGQGSTKGGKSALEKLLEG